MKWSSSLLTLSIGASCALCAPLLQLDLNNVVSEISIIAGVTVSVAINPSPTTSTSSSNTGPISGAPSAYTAPPFATKGPYSEF